METAFFTLPVVLLMVGVVVFCCVFRLRNFIDLDFCFPAFLGADVNGLFGTSPSIACWRSASVKKEIKMRRILFAFIFVLASPAFAGMADLEANANAGDAEAQYLMGYSYERGENNPRNPELAAQWYQKAVSHNFARAQHRFGLMYATGIGVPRDFSKTVALFDAAAKQKYPAAQMDYAMLLSGVAPPAYVNKPEAYAWFEVIKANYRDAYSSICDLHEKLKEQLSAEELAEAKARGARYVEQYSP